MIFKFIIYPLVLILVTIFILERLYLLPINISLDSRPSGKRSATYLAKTISNIADCSYGISIFEIGESNTSYDYTCDINQASFSIIIYLHKETKKIEKQTINKQNTHPICFKEGDYYLICENPTFKHNRSTNPIFEGKKYYVNFPGKNILSKR